LVLIVTDKSGTGTKTVLVVVGPDVIPFACTQFAKVLTDVELNFLESPIAHDPRGSVFCKSPGCWFFGEWTGVMMSKALLTKSADAVLLLNRTLYKPNGNPEILSPDPNVDAASS
jgi:hypothetical protein